MNEPLRPSSLSEILDRTAHIYRARFLLFLGISVIPTGVMVTLACIFGLVAAWWSASGARSVSAGTGFALVAVFSIAVTLLALPVLLAATALATAAINHAISHVYLGETTTIRDAYKTVWRRGWRYVGLYLLQGLLVWGVPIAVWIALIFLAALQAKLAGTAGKGAAANMFLGLSVFVFLFVMAGYIFWMLLRLALAFPACVVEQVGAVAALKRSSALSRGTKGRILLLYFLGAALSWLLSMGVTLPLLIIEFLIPGMSSPKRAQFAGMVMLFIVYGASFAVQALTKPIYGIALALFYFDQRIRIEGFDIEWMMQQAGMVGGTAAAVDAPATAPEAEQEPATLLPIAPPGTNAAEGAGSIQYDQRIRKEGFDIEKMMDVAGMTAPVTLTSGDGPVAPGESEKGSA